MFWTALPRKRPSSETSSTSSSVKASGSTRTSETIPTVRAPTTSGAARRERSPSSLNSVLLGVFPVGHVLSVDRLARSQNVVEQRARDRAAGARREDRLRAGARCRDHARGSLLGEHDRRAVERDEAAKLPDEGREGLLDLERRAERAGAAVGSVEQVDPAAELVTKALRLRGPALARRPSRGRACSRASR